MKKLIATLALGAFAGGAFAQGIVTFANTPTSLFQTESNGVVTSTAAGATGSYDYELLTAASTVTSLDASLQGLLSATWTDTTLMATNTAAAGKLNAGSQVTVPTGWPGGAQEAYIVVGWSANEGSSWATVSSELAGAVLGTNASGNLYWSGGGLKSGGYVGATVIGNAESGGGPLSLPSFVLFGSAASGQGTPIIGSTELYLVSPVPEPTTFALAGLGAAAMLIFRRRK